MDTFFTVFLFPFHYPIFFTDRNEQNKKEFVELGFALLENWFEFRVIFAI